MSEAIKELLKEVDVLKKQLVALRPLPEEALQKIQDALDIEYTYESNRIEGNTLTLQETALVVNEGVTVYLPKTLSLRYVSSKNQSIHRRKEPFHFIG